MPELIRADTMNHFMFLQLHRRHNHACFVSVLCYIIQQHAFLKMVTMKTFFFGRSANVILYKAEDIIRFPFQQILNDLCRAHEGWQVV